jgi:hypothetical protein
MFKPFSSAYSNQVAAFMERCQGLTSMSKRDFYPMFMAAWEASFKEDTILSIRSVLAEHENRKLKPTPWTPGTDPRTSSSPYIPNEK